jgi:hopanoid biosynthesis associated RND transporter like protein HpnN
VSQTKFEDQISRWLGRWVAAVDRRASAVCWASVLVTIGLATHAALSLGINSDNMSLLPDKLPSHDAYVEFKSLFLTLDAAILVVIDAKTPELARAAGEQMETALRAQSDHFTEVYMPGGGPFFEEHGLLYRSLDDLDRFAEQMARMQPVMAELERDPSMAQLAEIVQLSLEDMREKDSGADDWSMVLDRVSQATIDLRHDYGLRTSWEEILLRGSSIDVTTRRVLVAKPILEFGSVFGAGDAIDAIHRAAESHGLVPERGVQVRVTGNPALNYEEMIGLMWDIGTASLFCFALVAVIVFLAVRSFRLMVAVVATLLAGLLWTSSYAALAVGHLNLISISFAVLFIGLGVDFGIHLGMSYASHRRQAKDHETALADAISNVGGSLVLCGFTTAIGFFVFVPTDYRGIAELGVIATGGMVVIVFLFMTLFPALISSWLRVPAIAPNAGDVHFRFHWWGPFERHPGMVRGAAAIAFIGGLLLLPSARFDPNVINMRDDETVSVQAFNELLDEPGTAPWYINLVEPNLEAAQQAAAGVRKLEGVSRAITLADYVPDEQEDKLDVLEDIAMLLDVPSAGWGGGGGDGENDPAKTSSAEQIQAIRKLHDFFGEQWMNEKDTVLAKSITKLRGHLADFLARVEQEDDAEAALAGLEEILFAGLPGQIERLRRAVNTGPVTFDDLPDELVNRMRAADGRARVQIFPERHLGDLVEMKGFVRDVQAVEPGATSVVVNLVEFGDVTIRSFGQALLSAAVMIMLVLFAIWRDPLDVMLAMTPLLLSAVLTGAAMVVMDLPFDFSNVIVIPLLFGIGVDSGIHLVHRFKLGTAAKDGLLGTTTARAVFYSALTTTASFGSLAFSGHNGMSILGKMLTAGMLFTIICNLIVLPSLLALRPKPAVGH